MLTRPIDKPYISLDDNGGSQFRLLYLQEETKYWIKKVFDKTIAAQVRLGSNIVIFNFLENDVFFLELCRIFGFFQLRNLMISAALKGY